MTVINPYVDMAKHYLSLMPKALGPKEFGMSLLNKPRKKFKGYMRNKK